MKAFTQQILSFLLYYVDHMFNVLKALVFKHFYTVCKTVGHFIEIVAAYCGVTLSCSFVARIYCELKGLCLCRLVPL